MVVHVSVRRALARRLAGDEGFTMIFALVALFVSALLVAAAFSAANGDVKLTHRATLQQKAYYAAIAGINHYQYQLTSSPEYWTKCPALGSSEKPFEVTGAPDETYYVKTLGANGLWKCESGKQATILETSGTAKGTFRIISTGTVKEGKNKVTRRIVATFSHPGFTKYVYETNYEVEDPVNFGEESSLCEHYYAERVKLGLTGKCPPIEFAPEDKVNGPMHTNDATEVCTSGGSAPTFGREGYNDAIEMNGGHYAASGCSNTPNILGTYTESAGSVLPPETDAELLEAAGKKYKGRTEIELNEGSPNTMTVKNKEIGMETIPFPSNGVVYVENSPTEACAITSYTPFGSDTTHDTGCGNVYVHGKYTESLTIASADDVIVNGNLTTTEENGEPTGSATLGLIAENFVRVYHPVKERYEARNTIPATEAPINGKCVTEKELSGKVVRSTEVNEITTTGLEKGAEVEGTVPGMIESGTTVSEVKGSSIKLSKAAKPTAKEITGKFTNASTEIKEVETSGLMVGQEVEGTAGQLETGTTITEIKAGSKAIKVSKAAKVTAKEAGGKVLRSNEVSEITTTGLAVGQEVEGPGGQIEAGTTITEVKAGEEKIKLSKSTKQSVKELTGSTHGTTEVTGITPTGLVVGDEVEGSGISAGTTVTEIKSRSKVIKLSKAATKSESGIKLKFYGEAVNLKFYERTLKVYGETTKLIFYVPTKYALNASLNVCHKVEGFPYTEYRESENRYIVRCSEATYEGEGFCKYENNSNNCAEGATNLSASEDPNHWGSLENPVIDAAILSTNHSWIVDNYKCGKKLGTLTVWGSIAQFWRGPVGTSGNGGTGYIKSYNYDNRLADQQPPSFLAPTNASSWKVTREIAPSKKFEEEYEKFG
jgi:hypothetical protein